MEHREASQSINLKNTKEMKRETLTATLLAIAANNPQGFTVNAQTLQPIAKGFAVAVAETQNSFGATGLARVIDYVQANEEVTAFGGWYNSEDGQYYYDATLIFSNLAEALRAARLNKQYAIFDLSNGEEIRL